VKIARMRREEGLRLTIAAPSGRRQAKHPGEEVALCEAQMEALASQYDVQILLMDEDKILYTVEKAGKAVTTYAGSRASSTSPETVAVT
jgi:hypothetical protein